MNTATAASFRRPGLVLAALSLVVALSPPAFGGGRVKLTMQHAGAVTGGRITVEFTCTAQGEGDGRSIPDPHKVRVACALENAAGRRWPATSVESRVVPLAATASTAVIAFEDVPGLRLCGVAEADFSDGSTAVENACVAADADSPGVAFTGP